MTDVFLETDGYCPACDQQTTFSSQYDWLRDHFRCIKCGSLPRERALILALERYFPDWRKLVIHESSPGKSGASAKLVRECLNYIPTHYFPTEPPGSEIQGYRCENLESLTFPDESVDLHVSQDVMEHVLDTNAAFKELARTLKPGGAHLFTAPLVRKADPSEVRAKRNAAGNIDYLKPPEYHRNPIDESGALVTIDWGYDIARHIFDASGLFTHILTFDDLSLGIRAEYIEVMLTLKPTE